MQKNHRETPSSTATDANPWTTTVHTSFTTTAATPSWPLPQLLHFLCPNSLHRHCRNSFTTATTTSSLPLPQLLAPPCLFLCIQPPQLLARLPLQLCLPLLLFSSLLIRYHHHCIIHHQFYKIYCQQEIRSFLSFFFVIEYLHLLCNEIYEDF